MAKEGAWALQNLEGKRPEWDLACRRKLTLLGREAVWSGLIGVLNRRGSGGAMGGGECGELGPPSGKLWRGVGKARQELKESVIHLLTVRILALPMHQNLPWQSPQL